MNKRNETKKSVMAYFHDLTIFLAIILVVFMLLFRVVVVSGPSMMSTLLNGDYLIVLNQFFVGEPQPGDIVVISKSDYDNGTPIIKRVIATEGQEVRIHNQRVYVDGVLLNEPYIHGLPTTSPAGEDYSVIVEPGCVFVMGDNRVNSKDSRSNQIGQIDCRQIIGKAIFCIFPGADSSGKRDFGRLGGIG